MKIIQRLSKVFLLLTLLCTFALSASAQDTLITNCIIKIKEDTEVLIKSQTTITINGNFVSFLSKDVDDLYIIIMDTINIESVGSIVIYDVTTNISTYSMKILHQDGILTVVGIIRDDGAELYYAYDKYATD